MARLVSTQTGTRRSRIRVINRHVTVRHEPSAAFLQSQKNRRILTVLADSGPREIEQDLALFPQGGEAESGLFEPSGAHVDRHETTQLPRLGAYLDRAGGPGPPSQSPPIKPEPVKSDAFKGRERKERRSKSAGRSAYEQLCAKWGRI